VPHTYECALRWADMDLLGHVNNVTYLDYLAEARRAALAGSAAAHAVVTAHTVEFEAPLVFRREPVLVDSELTEDGLRQVVRDEDHTYVTASTTLGEALPGTGIAQGPVRSTYDAVLRRSDVDGDGHVTDVQHVELFQEARIRYLMDLHTRGQRWTHHVVARTDVQYLAPVALRPEAYAVHSRIGRLGTRSFTIASELCDGEDVLARAQVVMVTFDTESQRPADMAPEQRARLEEQLG
jgi:acyl-CoA thioester hydrolase